MFKTYYNKYKWLLDTEKVNKFTLILRIKYENCRGKTKFIGIFFYSDI